MQEFTFASLSRRFDSTGGISEGDPILQLFCGGDIPQVKS